MGLVAIIPNSDAATGTEGVGDVERSVLVANGVLALGSIYFVSEKQIFLAKQFTALTSFGFESYSRFFILCIFLSVL